MSESNQQLAHLLNDPFFVRWINGKANPSEQLKWDQWEEESPSNTGLKRKAYLLYKLPMEIVNGSDVEEQLALLQKRIDKDKKIFGLPSRGGQRSTGYRWAVAAAIALLISMIGSLTFYSQQNTKKTTSSLCIRLLKWGMEKKGF